MEERAKKPPIKLSELDEVEPGILSYMEKKKDERSVVLHRGTWQVFIVPLFISLLVSLAFFLVVSQLFIERSQVTLLEQRIEILEGLER